MTLFGAFSLHLLTISIGPLVTAIVLFSFNIESVSFMYCVSSGAALKLLLGSTVFGDTRPSILNA